MSKHVALPLLLAPVLLVACSRAPAPAAPQAQPVRVVIVGASTSKDSVTATGIVGSREETRLSFKTGGVISRILVEAGDKVRKGQILAALDSTEIDAQLRQAEENLAKTRRDRDRAEQLFKMGLLAQQLVQDARTQVALAESSMTSVRFNRQYATIVAPADGSVLQRLAEPRELAAPGAPILVTSRDDLGWVLRVGLSDQDAVRVHPGDAVEIHLNAYPEQVISTRVREVGAASDLRSGTVTATVTLPALAGVKYLTGQVGEARIVPQAAAGTAPGLSVPLGAILEGNGHEAGVYVIGTDLKAARRTVTLGSIHSDNVDVVAGLQPGERVVSEGAAWLNAGMPVRILR